MKTYRKHATYLNFEMSIPDGWATAPMVDRIDDLMHPGDSSTKPAGVSSYSETMVGPDGKYLHILTTPLSDGQPVPNINQTRGYFDGLTNRQNLNVIATGTIKIANQEHFWATYYRGFLLSLAAGGQMQFFKKYCLYLDRVECLITAGLFFVNPGGRVPTDQDLRQNERIYDEIVSSIRLLDA